MRRLLLCCIALVLLALSPHAEAAVACSQNCSGVSEIINNSPSSPITNSSALTVSSGSNQVLVLYVVVALGSTVTMSATWDGVSMTQIENHSDPSTTTTNVMFCLANPATGAQTLSITYSGGTPANVDYSLSVFTGANQTTPCNNGIENTGTSVTTLSVGVTSATGNIATALFTGSGSPTITTGTQIFASTAGTDTQEAAGYITGASTATITSSNGSSGNMNGVGMNIAAAGGGTVPNFSTFFVPPVP